jgi:hypothetical protein
VQKLLFLSLLVLPLASLRAESIELRDGTKVDGKIFSVTADTVLMEVQTSPTIREEKSYPRSEVTKMQRATQDDVAYAEVTALTVPSTANHPAVYDARLEKVRAFMAKYAYSKHMPEARKLAAALESERARVTAGEVKLDGAWVAADADASPAERTELGGRVQLAKMKETSDPIAAMTAFEVLEKNHNTSSAYPESVKVARDSLVKLRTNLLRAQADLDRRNREQEQGLQLASVDRRLQMEQGLAQEMAAVQAQVERTKQSGSKWIPVLPDAKLLADLSGLMESEETRLSKIDIESLAAGATAVNEAQRQLAAGDLTAAQASLEQARKLWPQHVMLASLQESLKKVETEATQNAANTKKEPDQP